jgi:3-dehydroquinate dehydratase/shikimate dehydrogenase
MTQKSVFSIKIASMARSTNDALRMLLFARKHPSVSVICMGEKGEFARVLAPVVGNRVNYACLHADAKTGPGQLTVEELMRIYHYDTLDEKTAIYGLIGNPVEKSPGHIHHNAVFRKRGCNAVYVKMQVQPEELSEFIPLAKELGIRGLSVTIPLKEKILSFIDEIDSSIGAINTLKFEGGKIFGTNTDGLGALDAIEKKSLVREKKVVLLGAGGAARAIAFEAKKRGAHVFIVNRTVERAEALAKEVGCLAGEMPGKYDILINCSPIAEERILPNVIAMDVVYAPKETPFLQAARRNNCQIVYGEEMYLNQAAGQTKFWL